MVSFTYKVSANCPVRLNLLLLLTSFEAEPRYITLNCDDAASADASAASAASAVASSSEDESIAAKLLEKYKAKKSIVSYRDKIAMTYQPCPLSDVQDCFNFCGWENDTPDEILVLIACLLDCFFARALCVSE